MSGIFVNLWQEFWAASTMAKFSFGFGLLSLSVFSGFIGWLLSFSRYRSYRAIALRQVDQLAKLHNMVDAAEADAVRAQAETAEWQPQQWLKTAAKEREQGNEERAICAIEDGFERVRADFAACMVALAGHHLSLIVSHDPEGRLVVGTRFALIASNLDPTDADAAFLLEETQLLADSDPGAVADNLPVSQFPHDQQEAIRLLDAIFARGSKLFGEGHYRLCIRLYRRAELIANRAGLVRSEYSLAAAYRSAQAMEFAREHQRALDAVTALLPIRERVSGKEHPETLSTRHLEAQILLLMGEHQRALDAVTALLPIRERVSGKEHSDTLTTRRLEARILVDYNRPDDALAICAELSALEPPTDRMFSRLVEALALTAKGDIAGGRELVDSVIEVMSGRLAPSHYRLVEARALRVRLAPFS